MPYSVRTFIASNGERFSQLYDLEHPGFPLFYPTAFISRSVRIGTTHETQKVYLEAIKRVCEWELKRDIDLASRFHTRQYLTVAEIDDLALHIRARKPPHQTGVIGNLKYNTYIRYTEQYLRWLLHEVITDSNNLEVKAAAETQSKLILKKKIRKTGSKSAREQSTISKKLPATAQNQLLDLFQSPFIRAEHKQDYGPRLRNVVILRILYATGMRIGEALSLKLKNFVEAVGGESAYLIIERNHDDPHDPRPRQPAVKTRGRKLPISQELEAQILEYITDWRADVPGAGFSDESFIFITHRARRSQGDPLQISAFEAGVGHLKRTFPALSSLHPHLLRHDWNYRFSIIADSLNMPSEEEARCREELEGWETGSKSAKKYNRRHIEEKAFEMGLLVAADTSRYR